MAKLILEHVSKDFEGAPALRAISTVFEDGKFIALLGPSGCGKSTLLRCLAGFETPSHGRIQIGDQEVANAQSGHSLPPEKRNIGFVFQSYALWPHMTVNRNVGYPLEIRGLAQTERNRRIAQALEATELTDFADRMPSELSGGQRQRVALARCLVSQPTAVLLDEPLANLDVALRAAMQDVFSNFHQTTGATMVYVTHDQAEAMAMADRIAVMDAGQVVQFDTPETLYAKPRTRFVAQFIGEGAVLPISDVSHEAGRVSATLLGQRHAIDIGHYTDPDCAAPSHVCLRPEQITLSDTGDLRAEVIRATYLGGTYRLSLKSASGEDLTARSPLRHTPGEQVGLSLSPPWAFADTQSEG